MTLPLITGPRYQIEPLAVTLADEGVEVFVELIDRAAPALGEAYGLQEDLASDVLSIRVHAEQHDEAEALLAGMELPRGLGEVLPDEVEFGSDDEQDDARDPDWPSASVPTAEPGFVMPDEPPGLWTLRVLTLLAGGVGILYFLIKALTS